MSANTRLTSQCTPRTFYVHQRMCARCVMTDGFCRTPPHKPLSRPLCRGIETVRRLQAMANRSSEVGDWWTSEPRRGSDGVDVCGRGGGNQSRVSRVSVFAASFRGVFGRVYCARVFVRLDGTFWRNDAHPGIMHTTHVHFLRPHLEQPAHQNSLNLARSCMLSGI